MVMVMNNTSAFVLFVLLCAALISTARLHPAGAEVSTDTCSSSKIGAATASTTKSQPTKIFDDEKSSKKVIISVEAQVVRNKGKIVKQLPPPPPLSVSHYNEKRKRRLRRRWSDEVDMGFVAFSADYRGPRHHPPKNN
ncbi:uncharacterized protein LOC129298836 [Prosopis cineraria]|uniref:uncharacterized protein LOC129298836 n=1 Tax=Prosopis cineraria TaxID=364024 RepID=UPI00241009A3|nr:uncharacterized protein LOC129298836 [Prosopis cineraria]